MKQSKRDDGWRMSDALWERIEPLLPAPKPHPLGCHRPRVLNRAAMDAILLVLRKSAHPINGLRALGCKVCLADFGKGMRSFVQLKNLQVDFIKIDSSLGSAAIGNAVEEETVKLVHKIARITGKETIAGWVEDEATAKTLSRIRIDYLQGNWISYPKELAVSLSNLH